MKKILIILSIILLACPAWGATYTVCSSGCDEAAIQDVIDNNDLGNTTQLEDDCQDDDTSNWIVLDCTLGFDTDHYEVDYSAATQYIGVDGPFAAGTYTFSYEVKDGTASGVATRPIFCTDAWGNQITGGMETTTSAWQKIEHTLVLSSSRDRAAIYFNAASGNVEVRNILVNLVREELDTIIVSGATYREQVTIGWLDSGSVDYPVTIRGASGETIIINAADVVDTFAGPDGNGEYTKGSITTEPQLVISDGVLLKEGAIGSLGATEWGWNANILYLGFDPSVNVIEIGQRSYGVRTTGADYVTLKNLTIKYANAKGIYNDDSDSLIIDDCDLLYANEQMILNDGGENLEAKNNTIIGGVPNIQYATGGIQSRNGDNPSIYGNDISHAKFGIQIGGASLTASATTGLIEKNNIHDLGISQTTYEAADWQAIELTGDATYSMDGITIRGNFIKDIAGAGIGLYRADSNIVSNNIMVNCGLVKFDEEAVNEGGIGFWSDSDSNVAYNNTIYNCRSGIMVTLNNDSNTLVNNNIVFIEYLGIFISSTSTGNTNDYNNLYDISGTAWADAAIKGANALEVDPEFVDPTNDNFRLKRASPAIDAGTTHSLLVAGWTSFYGATRLCGDGADIGAGEYCKSIIPKDRLLILTRSKTAEWYTP